MTVPSRPRAHYQGPDVDDGGHTLSSGERSNEGSASKTRARSSPPRRVSLRRSLVSFADKWGSDYRHVQDPEVLLPKAGRFQVPQRIQASILTSRARCTAREGARGLRNPARRAAGDRRSFRRAVAGHRLHEGLAALAGNGTRRYQQFRDQVTAFHAEWRRFFETPITEALAITEEESRHGAALPLRRARITRAAARHARSPARLARGHRLDGARGAPGARAIPGGIGRV
jgi:ABC-2 type transport system permease protein